MDLKKIIKTIPDFPIDGIQFRDITPILLNPEAFNYVVNTMAEIVRNWDADVILGSESRGFIFACPIASKLNMAFVPIRKPGKLPREVISQNYELEYGTNSIEIHKEDIQQGQKVVIVDDLLATGGTIKAAIDLVESQGAEVVGCVFLIRLKDLNGLEKIKKYEVKALLEY